MVAPARRLHSASCSAAAARKVSPGMRKTCAAHVRSRVPARSRGQDNDIPYAGSERQQSGGECARGLYACKDIAFAWRTRVLTGL